MTTNPTPPPYVDGSRDTRYKARPSRFKAKAAADDGAGRTVQIRMGRSAALITEETALRLSDRIVDAVEVARANKSAQQRPAAPRAAQPVHTSYGGTLTAADGTAEPALPTTSVESE